MFQCGICKEQSKPGQKAHHIVVEQRAVTYPPRQQAHLYKDAMGKWMKRDDPGGQGTEIVREVLAHEKCARVARAAAA